MNTFDVTRFISRFGIALLLLIALAIPLGLVGPTKPDTAGYDDAVDSALGDAESNEDLAAGAPQQAVVNGWLARDLMLIQIEQNNDQLVLQHLSIAVIIAALLAAVISAGSAARSTPAQDRGDSARLADDTISTDVAP